MKSFQMLLLTFLIILAAAIRVPSGHQAGSLSNNKFKLSQRSNQFSYDDSIRFRTTDDSLTFAVCTAKLCDFDQKGDNVRVLYCTGFKPECEKSDLQRKITDAIKDTAKVEWDGNYVKLLKRNGSLAIELEKTDE